MTEFFDIAHKIVIKDCSNGGASYTCVCVTKVCSSG